jgi:hypothetical protein
MSTVSTIRRGRVLLLVAGAIASLTLTGCQKLKAVLETRPSEKMPAYKPADVQFANQNWSAGQRAWFYHAPQGSELMPYKWFMALEQPKLKLFGTVPKFSDSTYLAGFGFLPDAAGPQNPDGALRATPSLDVNTGQRVEVVGLSCAACHTGPVE